MKNNTTGEIIFKANQAWNLLYYDDFHTYENYQISWLAGADRPYYNCIHVDGSLTHRELREAESYFTDRSVCSRVYTHTYTDIGFINLLQKEGYNELPEEEEIWYEYPIEELSDPLDLARYYKKALSDIDLRLIDPGSDELEHFMKLNQDQNDIPMLLVEKFTQKIRKNTMRKDIPLECFAAFYQDLIITIGTMSCINDLAFFSEGATDIRFTRQGLYSMMLAFRINQAYQRKCRFAYVNCDKNAWSNHGCLKLGFNRLFTRKLWERRR